MNRRWRWCDESIQHWRSSPGRQWQGKTGHVLGGLLRRLRNRRPGPERKNPGRGRRVRHRLLASGGRRQGPRRGSDGGRRHRRVPVQRQHPHQRAGTHGPPAAQEVQGPGGLRVLRLRRLHPGTGQSVQPGRNLPDRVSRYPLDGEPTGRPATARDARPRRHAASARVLRFRAHAGTDRAGGLFPARMPA